MFSDSRTAYVFACPPPTPIPQPPPQPAPWSHSPIAYPPYNYYPFPGFPTTSPASVDTMDPFSPANPDHAVVHEYPDDPSFDTTSDGRIEMAQDEIDAIIRNKRKIRDPKACYACHRRKVKCDRNLPCDSCVKRDHPELCSYERPTKKRRIALTGSLHPHQDGSTAGGGGGGGRGGVVGGGVGGVAGLSDGHDPAMMPGGHNITVPREKWDRLHKELLQLREATKSVPSAGTFAAEVDDGKHPRATSRSDQVEREGIHAPSNQMGTIHLGSRSVLAYMMGLGRAQSTQDAARSLLEENILPKLGLDNESATYPFVDLWSTDTSMQDVNGLCKALPDDELCHEFFYAYRDVAGTIYPIIPDIDAFEVTLNAMLTNRAHALRENRELDPNRPYGVSLPWLALVFAVFASGAQSSDRPAKERELTSQVYVCCSYQALRMSNFLTHPCLETIEASLTIGNVLSYNMNPGVAYIFLGMTLRMAFSIGIQINSQNFSEAEQWIRGRVWWALAWQDSHFSVSYDRPTSSVLCIPDIPYAKYSAPGNRSYAESMFAIIRLTQEIIRERCLNPRRTMTWQTILRYKDEIAAINADAAPHLRDRNLCLQMTQHLERLALRLHSSYINSELCRPALKESSVSPSYDNQTPVSTTSGQSPTAGRRRSPHVSGHSPHTATPDFSVTAQLRRDCIKHLEECVETYVELHSRNKFAARSWIGIQRTISAAFLLGTLPEANQEPRILSLLRNLEQVIAQRTIEDPAFEGVPGEGLTSPMRQSTRRLSTSRQPPLAESPHWARSMTKSLHALGKMNAALAGPKPPGQKSFQGGGAYMTNGQPMTGGAANLYAMQQNHISTGAPRGQYTPITNLSQEPYSPAMSIGAGMNVGPITPDSTASSSDWNYTNMTERALEYVQPALWG